MSEASSSVRDVNGGELWRFLRRSLLSSRRVAGEQDVVVSKKEAIREKLTLFNTITSSTKSVPSDGEHDETLSHLTPFVFCSFDLGAGSRLNIVRRSRGSIGRLEAQEANCLGIDSTGLSSIWPSEQALTQFCIERGHLFSGQRVLELGAGQAGLAGLAVAKLCSPAHVLLSDGHPLACQYLAQNIRLNGLNSCDVSSQKILWNDPSSYCTLDRFDRIIVSDCLFFEQYHQALLETLCSLLSSDGIVVYVGPPRGGSLERFRELSASRLQWEQLSLSCCKKVEGLHATASKWPLYNADFHRPAIALLRHRAPNEPRPLNSENDKLC